MRQVAHRIVHFFGASGAVQADNLAVEGLQRRFRRANFRAQQHGAGLLQRDLRLHRNAFAALLHGFKRRSHGNFRLQNVLASFNQQNVHAAVDQSQ